MLLGTHSDAGHAVLSACLLENKMGIDLKHSASSSQRYPCKKEGDRLFSRACCDRTKGYGFKLKKRGIWIGYKEGVFCCKSSEAAAQAAPSMQTAKVRPDRL